MPVSSKVQLSRPEKTKKLIVSNASKVFFERGIRNVSVEELCNIIPVSKYTFYKYFSNRDDLVETIFNEIVSELFPAMAENYNSQKDLRSKIETHYKLYLNVVASKVSPQMMMDVENQMPELWEFLQKLLIGGRKLLIQLYVQGQQEGLIREDLDPEAMSVLIVETIQRATDNRFLASNGLTFHQAVFTIHNIIIDGIWVRANE